MKRGLFVVIYAANNLGKSTQVEILTKKILESGLPVKSLKYPIYDLVPTGPLINSVLREGYPMSDLDLQGLFAQNRRDFEPKLKQILHQGINVVAEDYTGTGIAWGLTKGLDLVTLEDLNADLLKEDMAFLLDGNRFASGIERGHRHEEDTKWELARRNHLDLAERYGWEIINANQSQDVVAQNIFTLLQKSLH